MKLFVGLGNPEPGYARNRHNIGFMAADAIAAAHGFGPWRAKFHGQIAEGRLGPEKVLLLKPGTYMNLSGDAVRAALQFYKLEPGDVVVFHDELDLAPGRVRVKTGGGTAGHNGIRSIAAHIGPDFTRVRLGIGHPGDKRLVSNYVLGDFAKADAEWVDDLLARRRRRRARRSPPATPPASSTPSPGGCSRPPPPKPARRSPPPRRPPPRPSPRSTAQPAAKAGGPLPLTVARSLPLPGRSTAPAWARPSPRGSAPSSPTGSRPAAPWRTGCWAGPATRAPTPCRCGWPAPCTASCSKARDPGLAAVYPPHEPPTRRSGRRWRPPSTRARALSSSAASTARRRPTRSQRTAALCPGFLTVAALTGLPLATSELGASAGLNLSWDRFAYRFGAAAWGDPASPLTHRAGLAAVRRRRCRPPGSPSAPAATWRRSTSASRRGPAAAPLLRLGRPDRAHGAHAPPRSRSPAPTASASRPPTPPTGSPARLDAPRPGRAHVVYHSIFWQYLPAAAQERIGPASTPPAARASPTAPLAWLRMEGDGAEPGAAITLTPLARRRDARARPVPTSTAPGWLGRLGLKAGWESRRDLVPDDGAQSGFHFYRRFRNRSRVAPTRSRPSRRPAAIPRRSPAAPRGGSSSPAPSRPAAARP